MTDTALLAGSVLPIAEDLFTAMVDGEPGHVLPGEADDVAPPDAVHAWVDLVGTARARTLVVTARTTADRITRALLAMEDDEPVVLADVQDALGEVANVLGGNLKGLTPELSSLTVPVVGVGEPPAAGQLAWQEHLRWRGHPIVVSMWHVSENGERR